MSHSWDQDFEILESEVNKAEQFVRSDERAAIYESIEKKHNKLAEISSDIQNQFQRLTISFKKRQLLKGRMNIAIGYWIQHLTKKIQVFYEESKTLNGRTLWMRVVQARFGSRRAGEAELFDPSYLLEMIDKRRMLLERENQLKLELKKVLNHRESLSRQYSNLSIAGQNWAAAAAFNTRLGVSKADATNHPSLKAFDELLESFVFPVQYPSEHRKLADISERVVTASRKIDKECASLAHEYVKTGSDVGGSKKFAEFKCFLTDMENLYSEFELVHQKNVGNDKGLFTRPKIVQN